MTAGQNENKWSAAFMHDDNRTAMTSRQRYLQCHAVSLLRTLLFAGPLVVLSCYTASSSADARIDAEMCTSGTGNLDLDRSLCERAAKAYSGATRATLLARKAGAEIWLGKYEHALRSIDTALEAFSSSALAYYERGRALRRLGQFEASTRAFDQAIVLWPRFTKAFRERGLSKLLQGQFQDADTDLSRAITLAPGAPEAWVLRGIGRYLAVALEASSRDGWPQRVSPAINDFEEAADLVYPYRYLPLWHFVADGRPAEHIDREGQLLPNEWPLAIAAHLRGELSLTQLEQEAQRSPLSARRLGHLYWFLGLAAARDQDIAAARRWLLQAAERGPSDTVISQLSVLLLAHSKLTR